MSAANDLACALIAYTDIRRALIAPDDMRDTEIRALQNRVCLAAEKYPEDTGGPVQVAENEVLRAYARYLEAVVAERPQRCG